jgi:hypothetical protein
MMTENTAPLAPPHFSATGKTTAPDGSTFLGEAELGGSEGHTFEDFALLILDIVHEVALCYHIPEQQVLGYMVEQLYVPTAKERAAEQRGYDRAYKLEPAVAAAVGESVEDIPMRRGVGSV